MSKPHNDARRARFNTAKRNSARGERYPPTAVAVRSGDGPRRPAKRAACSCKTGWTGSAAREARWALPPAVRCNRTTAETRSAIPEPPESRRASTATLPSDGRPEHSRHAPATRALHRPAWLSSQQVPVACNTSRRAGPASHYTLSPTFSRGAVPCLKSYAAPTGQSISTDSILRLNVSRHDPSSDVVASWPRRLSSP